MVDGITTWTDFMPPYISLLPLYYSFQSLPSANNRQLIPIWMCFYHGSFTLGSLPLLLDAQTMLWRRLPKNRCSYCRCEYVCRLWSSWTASHTIWFSVKKLVFRPYCGFVLGLFIDIVRHVLCNDGCHGRCDFCGEKVPNPNLTDLLSSPAPWTLICQIAHIWFLNFGLLTFLPTVL